MSQHLDKKDVRKAAITWWLCSHLTYNYQRLQAGAITTVMGPLLNKMYEGNEEKVAEGLQRHMLYFNTEPRLGAVLPGMVVALEEGIANNPTDEDVDASMVTEIKTALMGPLAGIGDTVFAGLLKPVYLSICLGWAVQGYIWGALAFGIGFTLIDFLLTYIMFTNGYKLGMNSVDRFLENSFINKITTFLGIVGLFCLGAMIIKYVSIGMVATVTLSTGKVELGELLNKIIPGLLPLLFTLLGYRLQVKGWSITKILLLLFAIGFVGGAIGLLG